MNPPTQSKKTTILPLLIPLLLACFALLPRAQAVLPPPDGGYPSQNTAEGDDALQPDNRNRQHGDRFRSTL